MKKIKLLPLLAVIPMLASCGGKPAKPKFAKFGDEVKVDVFDKKTADAVKKSVLDKKEIPSGTVKASTNIYYLTEHKRGNKVMTKSEQHNEGISEVKHDAKNLVIEGKSTSKSSYVKKSKEGTKNQSAKSVKTYVDQEAKIDSKKYVVSAYKDSKEFYKLATIVEEVNSTKSILNTEIRNFLLVGQLLTYTVESGYNSADKEGKKNYKFYQNGNIFTIDFKEEIENESKNFEDKVEYIVKGTNEITVQVQIEAEKVSYKYFSQREEVYEYKLDTGSNYAKGDVKKEVNCYVAEGEWKKKDVSLKAVDLSGYTQCGDEW